MYKVVLLPPAEKVYRRLLKKDPKLFRRIDNVLQDLKISPFEHKLLKDVLKGKRSCRVGDWRIIYSVESQHVAVYVFAIAHRREVYL